MTRQQIEIEIRNIDNKLKQLDDKYFTAKGSAKRHAIRVQCEELKLEKTRLEGLLYATKP